MKFPALECVGQSHYLIVGVVPPAKPNLKRVFSNSNLDAFASAPRVVGFPHEADGQRKTLVGVTCDPVNKADSLHQVQRPAKYVHSAHHREWNKEQSVERIGEKHVNAQQYGNNECPENTVSDYFVHGLQSNASRIRSTRCAEVSKFCAVWSI